MPRPARSVAHGASACMSALEAWRPASSQAEGLSSYFQPHRGYACRDRQGGEDASRGRIDGFSPRHRWQRPGLFPARSTRADVRTGVAGLWRNELNGDRVTVPGRHALTRQGPEFGKPIIQNGGTNCVGPPQRRAVRAERPRPSSIATLSMPRSESVVIARTTHGGRKLPSERWSAECRLRTLDDAPA